MTSLELFRLKVKMRRCLPATLVTVFILVAAGVSAEELSVLQPATDKAGAGCGTPAVPDKSNLIVLNGEGADRGDDRASLPNGFGQRINGEIAKSYARADAELRGYIGPGIDGLRTFYPGDPSDEIFGSNPMSQMPVIDVKGGDDECFLPPPSIERLEDIAAANRMAMAGLNLSGPPELAWKGGFESRWLRSQTVRLRTESGEWKGAQLPRTAMWSLEAASLRMPRNFEPGGPFEALDVAAWNNEQVQNLPR